MKPRKWELIAIALIIILLYVLIVEVYMNKPQLITDIPEGSNADYIARMAYQNTDVVA